MEALGQADVGWVRSVGDGSSASVCVTGKDPLAWSMDVRTLSFDHLFLYAYSPFGLIMEVVLRIEAAEGA